MGIRTERIGARIRSARDAVRDMFSPAHLRDQFTSKAFRAGGYTVAICLATIAIGAGALALIETLPTEMTSIDISESGTTRISDDTREYLESLEEDVTIYLIAEEGGEDDYLSILLGSYADAGDHVSVVQKDPVLYPTFTSEYTSESLSDNSLIIVAGDDSEVVSSSELYTLNSSTYSYEFAGESAITGAIVSLTTESKPVVYTLSGHGDASLPSNATDAIESANMEIAELNLLSEDAVPDDASAVILYGPQSDLSEDEADRLIDYLEDGGSFMLVSDYTLTDAPNLESVMDTYGLAAVDGIVAEGSAGISLAGYPYYLLPTVGSADAAANVAGAGTYVLFPLAHGIEETDDHRSSVTVEALLSTSTSAYVKTDPNNAETLEYEEGDIAGQTMVGAVATEAVSSEEDTRVAWFSSTGFVNSQIDARVGGTNIDLFTDTVAWLSDAEGTVMSIDAKGLGSTMLTMNASSATVLSVFFVGAVPLALLFIGFTIWRERRKS